MTKHHAQNERIKRKYLSFLQDNRGKSSSTVDQAAAAIAEFEKHTNFRDFKRFHIEQAKAFKTSLGKQLNRDTGKPLAHATIYSRLMALKAFFHWLAGEQGYKSRISYSDSEYFNTSANDRRIAHASRQRPVPTIEQIRHALFAMPTATEYQRRDQVVIAATLLTGARDNALASLSIKHLDFARREVFQDAREVRTKNAKTFTSNFFPVGDDVEAIVACWMDFLATEKLFGPADPAFPPTLIKRGATGLFEPVGLSRTHWKNAGAIRKIFKTAFENAGLPYFHPHSFRKTLVTLGLPMCQNNEEMKAWSQNLGHEKVETTLSSYGKVEPARQSEIFAKMRKPASPEGSVDKATLDAALALIVAQLAKK